MIEVEHPTLGVLEFPDGTSEDQILAAIKQAEQPSEAAPRRDLTEISADTVFGMPWGDNAGENFRTSAGMLLTFDREAQKNLWDTQLNAAGIEHRWEEGEDGAPVLIWKDDQGNEQAGYINAPGVSGPDVMGALGQGGAFMLGARGVASAPLTGTVVRSAGAGGRSALAGTGAALQSTASDALANTVGADISGQDMALNAGLSAAAGAVLQPVGEVAGRALSRGAQRAREYFRQAAGNGPEAVAATKDMVLESAGDAAPVLRDASSEFWQQVHQAARNANSPEEAVEAAVAEAFREQIPGFSPLRPYVTGRNSDFAVMDDVGRGRFGGQPQDELRAIQRDNQQAISERLRTVREDVTGQANDGLAGAGEVIRQNLRDAAGTAKEGVNEAYRAASQYSGAFTGEAVQQLPGRMDQALVAGGHKLAGRSLLPQNYPATSEMIGVAQDFAERGQMDIREFEQVRRYLQSLARGAQSSDRAAASAMMREFDNWGDDMLDQALYAGDDGAIAALKNARAANRDFKSRFSQNNQTADGRTITDRAGKVISDIINDDLSPTAVVNYLTGSSKIGQSKDAVAILGRLRNAVGTESQAWAALQEAGLQKLFYNDTGAMRSLSDITKQWDRLYKGDAKPWAMRLYGQKNMDDLNSLMTLLKRTQRDSRDYVPSGPAVGRLMDAITGRLTASAVAAKFPLVGQYAASALEGIRQAGEARTLAREGLEAIHPPRLEFIPNVEFSRAVGSAVAGGGTTGARAATN